MNNRTTDIQRAVDYIEAHLLEPIGIEVLAAKACASPFHFQRIFHALCGVTVGEYIRSRRLSLAAQELAATGSKVIDIALKYGYDSPDSFTRAFTRFHGISPSQARLSGTRLRAFPPMRISLNPKGGTPMEYRIIEKKPFTLVGVTRRFSSETSYQEIPRFWQEHMQSKDHPVRGMYGVCFDSDGNHFDYMIADDYVPAQDVPEGCKTRVIPGGLYAIFPCRGPLPKALQDVNTRIWSEWAPSLSEYSLGGNFNLEVYTDDMEYNEIWVPIKIADKSCRW